MCHTVSFHVGSPTIPVNIPFWCQDQLIGLEFFHDFAQRIPRDEVSEIVAMVRGSALKRYGSRLQPGGDFGRERIEGIFPPFIAIFSRESAEYRIQPLLFRSIHHEKPMATEAPGSLWLLSPRQRDLRSRGAWRSGQSDNGRARGIWAKFCWIQWSKTMVPFSGGFFWWIQWFKLLGHC